MSALRSANVSQSQIPTEIQGLSVPADRLEGTRFRAEARRREAFVRAVSTPLVGYSDGYADGFEHAMLWLLGKLSDPLEAEYRPSADMNFAKSYYSYRPRERARISAWFENYGKPKAAKRYAVLND